MARGRKRTKPKEFDEFWSIYLRDINKINTKLKKDRWLKRVAVISAVISVIIAYGVGTGLITPEKSSDIVAFETVQRIQNTTEEGYRLILHNRGEKFAENVEVKVTFPFHNSTIYKVYNNGEKILTSGYEYSYVYPKIREDEKIVLTILINNDDFEKEGKRIVKPVTRVWSDDGGIIRITYLEDQFIY